MGAGASSSRSDKCSRQGVVCRASCAYTNSAPELGPPSAGNAYGAGKCIIDCHNKEVDCRVTRDISAKGGVSAGENNMSTSLGNGGSERTVRNSQMVPQVYQQVHNNTNSIILELSSNNVRWINGWSFYIREFNSGSTLGDLKKAINMKYAEINGRANDRVLRLENHGHPDPNTGRKTRHAYQYIYYKDDSELMSNVGIVKGDLIYVGIVS